MLAGNQGRSRQQAMANSFGGAAQGGLGLLGPIMQNKQQQAQAALAAKKLGLEERQVGAYEAANTANAALHRAQAEAMARQQRALESAFPSEQQPTSGLLAPQQSPQAMIDAGGGAYMQTAPMVQQATQQTRPQIDVDKLLGLARGGVNIEPYLKLREAGLPKVHEGGFVGTQEDLEKYRGGMAPRLVAGQGGQVTMVSPDGRGGVQVTAPGLEAFRAMQDVENRSKASMEPVEIKLPSGEVRRMTREQQADWVRGIGAPAEQRTQGGLPIVPPPPGGSAEARAFEQVQASPPGVPQRASAPVDQSYQDLIQSFVRGGVSPTSSVPGYTGPATMPGVTTGPTAADIAEQERRKVGAVEITKADEKRVTELETKIPNLIRTQSRLAAMRALNADDKTYAAAGADIKRQLGSIAQAFGLEVNKDKTANTELYIAHVAELMKDRLASKDYGSGTGVSNLDLLAAKEPLPQLARTRDGRVLIMDALEKDTAQSIEDAKAAREYFDSNNYSLRGFKFPSESRKREPLPQGKSSPRDRATILKQYGIQ